MVWTVASFVSLIPARVAFVLVSSDRGCFVLSVRHVEAQAGHKDFERDKGKPPDFFAIFTESEGSFLFANLQSPNFVIYPDNIRDKLTNKLVMEATTTPPNSLFIGNDYIHQVGGECPEMHFLQYHMYLTPKDVQLKSGNAFHTASA